MTTKDKAKELIENFLNNIEDRTGTFLLSNYSAKQCALIAVDEIIKELVDYKFNNDMDDQHSINYWQEVKTEIKKL
jgi:hypothetical protein